MDLPTLVILLVSLTAAIVAGIAIVFKKQKEPGHHKRIKKEKTTPLMQNSESMQQYMGRHLSAIPYAIALVLVLVLLAKCGVV